MPFKSCDDCGGYHLGDFDDGSSGDKVELMGKKVLLQLMEMFSTSVEGFGVACLQTLECGSVNTEIYLLAERTTCFVNHSTWKLHLKALSGNSCRLNTLYNSGQRGGHETAMRKRVWS